MKASPRNFTTSSDGSLTIWVPELDEHYHSIHVAITESQHVFIDAGLMALDKEEISILEVGAWNRIECSTYLGAERQQKHSLLRLGKIPTK